MDRDPEELAALLASVVSVTTVSDAYDYEQPWQTEGPASSSGSGAIVETSRGLRVLTNAHCVENAVFVEVRRHGSPDKHVARVEAIGHECDLALLHVEDESLFEGTRALPIGELPRLGDRVQVCGYPIGGERLSVTQGLVSRIEVVRYAQSQRRLLAMQIDAAINAGNSGGPVLRDGVLVGVAFQALEGADRIGHSIAAPIVQHFVKDVEDGFYDGFPALGVVVQRLESRAHRRFLGLSEADGGGVLVIRVAYGSSAWGTLRTGDVLLELGGEKIAADGTVFLREGELVGFDYVVSKKQVEETLSVRFVRAGREREEQIVLCEPKYLVAEDRYDVPPSYYIFGGVLFVPLTRDYLKTWGPHFWHDAPRDLVAIYEHGIRTPEREEPVVLQKVLADRVNQGFHQLGSLLVLRAQSIPVRCLAHLVEIIEATDEPFVVIDLSDGLSVVLDRAEAIASHADILERFGVPDDRSEDLREDGEEE
jgi:S1-C subfamily serine protease